MIEIRIFGVVAFLEPCGHGGDDTECDDKDNNHDDPFVVPVPPGLGFGLLGLYV
jgi:hypothetical protein